MATEYRTQRLSEVFVETAVNDWIEDTVRVGYECGEVADRGKPFRKLNKVKIILDLI